jgi:YbbR domain-containing protein
MPWYQLSKVRKRKLQIFLSSLLVALALWVFFSLSKPYAYNTSIAIRFSHSLSSKNFRTDTFSVKVKGTGWDYLFHKLKPTPALTLKISSIQSDIQLNNQLDSLNKQLGKNLRILSIFPAKISFKTTDFETKEVPVVLRYKLAFERFYGLSADIKLQPRTVKISGSAAKLSQIKAVYTNLIEQKDVNTPIVQWVSLAHIDADLTMYPQQILATIPVSKFTEKDLSIPVRIKNNNKDLNVAIFPAKVHTQVLVALSNYNKISSADIEVYIDLENWDPEKSSTLPIKFGKMPNFVRLIRTEPETVDLLIYH